MSGQFFINQNCHNFTASHDIDMKLKAVTKFDKRNNATLKKLNNDVMSVNWDVVVVFLIYGEFPAVWKPSSESMAWKTYIFINSNLLP